MRGFGDGRRVHGWAARPWWLGLGAVLIVVAVGGFGTAQASGGAPKVDGTVTVSYGGTETDNFNSVPGNWQSTKTLTWSESETVELITKSGVDTMKVVSSSLTVSGGWKSTFGNSPTHDCSGTFSTLPAATPPIYIQWSGGSVSTSAVIPGQNDYTSAPLSCTQGTGITPSAAAVFVSADQPAATIDPDHPKQVTRPFDLQASDPQDVLSLDATYIADASDCPSNGGVLASADGHSAASKPLHVQAVPGSAATVIKAGGARLHATATDGCAPYKFAWQLVKRAAPKYVAVTKVSESDASSGRSAIYVKLECKVPRAMKLARPDGWLDLCAGAIGFEVDAKDSSHPQRKGHDFAVFKWEPRCYSPAQRKGLMADQKRLLQEILNGLGGEVAGKVDGLPFDQFLKLLELDTLGPFLALHETQQASLEASRLATAYFNDQQALDDPTC